MGNITTLTDLDTTVNLSGYRVFLVKLASKLGRHFVKTLPALAWNLGPPKWILCQTEVSTHNITQIYFDVCFTEST